MGKSIDGVKCEMLPDEDGDVVVPSVLYCPEQKGAEFPPKPWVGTKATRKLVDYPLLTLFDSKRMLDQDFNS